MLHFNSIGPSEHRRVRVAAPNTARADFQSETSCSKFECNSRSLRSISSASHIHPRQTAYQRPQSTVTKPVGGEIGNWTSTVGHQPTRISHLHFQWRPNQKATKDSPPSSACDTSQHISTAKPEKENDSERWHWRSQRGKKQAEGSEELAGTQD